MKELINKNDAYKMNWIEGNVEWGTVKKPDKIDVKITSEHIGDTIKESYCFTNIGNKDIFTSLTDISIYTPFNDDYKDSDTCMKNRCHTHIFCGDNISYVMALRMGGEAPHLGLVLTEGSIGGYSVERDIEKSSNDRGDFILHPSPTALVPNESFTVSWTLFWHNGKEDFNRKVKEYNKRFISVTAENYTVFSGDEIKLVIEPVFDFAPDEVFVMINGEKLLCSINNKTITVNKTADFVGEAVFEIKIKDIKTHCNIIVMPVLDELIEKRCEFIVGKQQYHNPSSGLDGAYLCYDNEEKHIYYNIHDYDGARERVVMGILIARYLRKKPNLEFEQSLDKYIKYIEREVFDKETGIVYNDYQRDNVWNRLYNYPWMSTLYLELYELYANKKNLIYAYRALKSFYEQGGDKFYALDIPVYDMLQCLEKEGFEYEKKIMQGYFEKHCEFIISRGTTYPAHEVNYEQTIVCPAAEILLQMYKVTGENKYIENAKKQLKILELFNGEQPDYHLYEVAIRHWDGYWFGKRKMYGDTFPHYWSSLTANAYKDFYEVSGEEKYLAKAEAAYRGSLSLFNPDGSASCACVYPVSVNGSIAHFYDMYANDQDWALYFIMRFRDFCERL